MSNKTNMRRRRDCGPALRPGHSNKRHIVDIPTSPPRPTLINRIDADPGSGHRIQGPDIHRGEKIQTACGTAFAKAGSRKSSQRRPHVIVCVSLGPLRSGVEMQRREFRCVCGRRRYAMYIRVCMSCRWVSRYPRPRISRKPSWYPREGRIHDILPTRVPG